MSMKISVTSEAFKLAQVFTISRGSRTEAKVLTVRVEKDGVVGWGECVPYARYDESLERRKSNGFYALSRKNE